MDLVDFFAAKARQKRKTVVFPEGEHPLIIQAAAWLHQEGLLTPVLIGRRQAIADISTGFAADLASVAVHDPSDDPLLGQFVADYSQSRSLPESVSRRLLRQPLNFAGMMVRSGLADGMVAGIDCPTGDVLLASQLTIGLLPGISVPSSFYIMDILGYHGSQDNLLIFADPAVNPDPTAAELADIAITTARSAQNLLGWQPRVAMLSFSTMGSACHPAVDKVARAVVLAQAKAPGLFLDGEMQADAALVMAVAEKKIGRESPVAGQANILIFPSLDAANISAKLVQQLAQARAFGPVLQGFCRPVSDLSRSAGVADIVGTAVMLAAQS